MGDVSLVTRVYSMNYSHARLSMASNYPLRINSLSFHLSSLFNVFCSGEQIEKNGTKFVPFFPAQFSSSRRLHDLKAWNKLLIYPCLTFNFFW